MLDYDDDDERDRQYSPSSMVEDVEELLARYETGSLTARSAIDFEEISYGSQERQAMDVFWASSNRVHVFIHGGYWQELSRGSVSFLAPGFRDRGTTFVALGYPLAPQATLEEIVASVRTGLEAAIKTVEARLGRSRIVLSGSSAGAHLAAMTAGAHQLAGLVLLSGIYDLVPLTRTYVNDALLLDEHRAELLSPLRLPPPVNLPPTLVALGEHETEAFQHQSEALARHWNIDRPLQIVGRNHFDVLHDLADRSTILGGAIAAWEDHGV